MNQWPKRDIVQMESEQCYPEDRSTSWNFKTVAIEKHDNIGPQSFPLTFELKSPQSIFLNIQISQSPFHGT